MKQVNCFYFSTCHLTDSLEVGIAHAVSGERLFDSGGELGTQDADPHFVLVAARLPLMIAAVRWIRRRKYERRIVARHWCSMYSIEPKHPACHSLLYP